MTGSTLLLLPLIGACMFEDFDQDGVLRSEDCNDTDPSQGRPIPLHVDADRDGFGDAVTQLGCPGNVWLVDNALDCNDSDAGVNPDASEVACDSRDNDCDPATVDGPAGNLWGTWPTLQEAVHQAPEGSEIRVCASSLHENVVIDRPVDLRGAGPDRTLLGPAVSGMPVLQIHAPTTVSGITITGGVATRGGGVAIDVPEGRVALREVIVRGNRADDGAGVWLARGELEIHDAQLLDNHAERGGGVFAVSPDLPVRLVGVEASGNRADEGGGLWLDGTAHLRSADIHRNTATHGGGVWLDGSITGTDSRVSGNSALQGGGMWVTGEVSGLVVSGNDAAVGGGVSGGISLTLSDMHIADNVADSEQGGGGVFATGPAVLDAVRLIDNEALAGPGGGLRALQAAFWQGGSATGNYAASDGGGLHLARPSDLDAVTIEGNSAGRAAGGIFASCLGGLLGLRGGSMRDNEAPRGAALHLRGGRAHISGLSLVLNSAASGSGAIQLEVDACDDTSLTVGADVGWADNEPHDLALRRDDRGSTYVSIAPEEPFLCDTEQGGAGCPAPPE